jgi:ATP synthase protein I
VSELEEYFLKARRLALNVVIGQLGVTLLVSAAGLLLGGLGAGISAFAGGSIGTLASLYMALSVFRPGSRGEPRAILRRLYRAELYKLLITAGLFALVVLSLDVSFGPTLGAFAATLVVYWVILGLQFPDLRPK